MKSIYFDTTNANTGQNSEACVILEHLLHCHLLYFPCRHHILKLVLGSVLIEHISPVTTPEIQLLKRFMIQWHTIDKVKYEDAFYFETSSSQFLDVKTMASIYVSSNF